MYFSTRIVGNGRRLTGQPPYQFLSESSLIPAVGIATSYWHGAMLWAEAGWAANYRLDTRNQPRSRTDFRGGLAFAKGFGHLMGAPTAGPYFETNADAVLMTQFDHDVILYSQNRAGYTIRAWSGLGGLQTQWFLAANFITDSRRQYWANAVEAGPGVRFRWSAMPPNWLFSVNWVRGRHSVIEGNPRERMYNDLRVGFWCSLLR
jgi:hypothetical protein